MFSPVVSRVEPAHRGMYYVHSVCLEVPEGCIMFILCV